MAAVQLARDTPARVALTANTMQRFDLPKANFDQPNLGPTGPWWVRIESASDCYLVYGTQTDGAALGSSYETIPAGVPTSVQIAFNTFAIAGSASQTVEVTAR